MKQEKNSFSFLFIGCFFFFIGETMALYEALLTNKTDGGKKIQKNQGLGTWYGKVLNGGTRVAYDKVPVFTTVFFVYTYIFIHVAT